MSDLSQNERFYNGLSNMLQNPPTEFEGVNYYNYGTTSQGLHYVVSDYPGMWLARPVSGAQERLAALQEGRAWITLQERQPDLSDMGRLALAGPEYTIVRPMHLIGGMGEFVLAAARRHLGQEPPLDQPLMYDATNGAVADITSTPFLQDLYEHATSQR